MNRKKQRYPSVDVFRYVCAVLVIAIHTGPFKEIDPVIGYIATDVIPRIAVPFFFIVSGYFYLRKLQNGEKPFWPYCKRLVAIYSVWSGLYFLIDFVQWGHADLKAFIVNCIAAFFYYGSSYHFWFFPALIFSICLTTLLWRIGAKRVILPLAAVLYTVGVLGCAYYNVAKDIPVLGLLIVHPHFTNIRRILLMGFPFFSGALLVLKSGEKLTKRQGFFQWLACALIWIMEIVVVVIMHCQQSIVLTFGLYPLVNSTLLVLLQNPMPEFRGIADISRKLANFTYYSHPALIMLIGFFGKLISGRSELPNTVLFLLTATITFTAGRLICKVNHPVFNQLIG